MEATVNYLLQSGLALLVLYLFYRVALRNQPGLTYNRLYLLLAPPAALLIPLLQLPLPFQAVLPAADVIPAIQLQEIQVFGHDAASPAAVPDFTTGQIILLLYSTVGFMLLMRLVMQLLRIRQLAAAATPVQPAPEKARLYQTDGHAPAFAFLHYVFLGNLAHLSEKEREQILRHELAHVRLYHTYDVLYYEILTVMLWFNPLVWLLKAELRDVHEFQADAEVLSNSQPQEYSALLAKEALFMAGIPVGSYFQKPQVFRRLRMLQLHGKPASKMRLLLALPVVLLLSVAFSANTVNVDAGSLPEAPVSLTESLITAPAHSAGIPTGNQETENSAAATAKPTPAGESSTAKPQISMVEPATTAPPAKNSDASDEKPFTYVEQMPQFKGGEAEMMKFLALRVRYPKDVQDAGVEGLVVLSFVVDKTGALHDITLLKSLHEDLDKEAIRVVEAMQGQWIPGRQNGKEVPVRYTLPVRFAIK